MSGTFGNLFGSSAKKQSSSTPTGYGSLSPEAQGTYNTALKGAQGLTAQNFAPAAFTPQQQQAAGYFGMPVSAITPEQFQSGLATYTNPFEDQVLQNTIGDLNTQAQGGYRDIASMASDAGGFGSNRRGLLESELQKNLLKTVGDISASSRSANFENAATRALNDIGTTRTMNQANMGSLFDIGTQFQNSNTATQNAPAQLNQYLATLASMLKGGGTKTISSEGDGGDLSSLAGGVGNISTIAAGAKAAWPLIQQGITTLGPMLAASDVRLKQNIKFSHKQNGFNIYEFAYKTDPLKKYKGVMAQEVQQIMPEAVIKEKGFYMVNYSMLGIEMRTV